MTRHELYGIGDRVTVVHVEDDRVVRLIGTVVGLATGPGAYRIKLDGIDDWRASEAVALLAGAEARRLP